MSVSNASSFEGKEGIDFNIAMKYKDGYKMIRLLTTAALDFESCHLNHCIGKGRFDDIISNTKQHPTDRFFSLRDPSNKPLATLHISNGRVLQAQGKNDDRIDPNVQRHVLDFISLAGYKISPNSSQIKLDNINDHQINHEHI